MLFNSYVFTLGFLPTVLAVYYLVAGWGHPRGALTWLVMSSLFYYGWWNPSYVGLIVVSMLVNYGLGRALGTTQGRLRTTLLVTGVTFNLALIGYYKYANFFVDTINAVLTTSWHLDTIVLPLAISFFTFQQIAYLVDTYRSELPESNFLSYCLFVTFFPQLIAGPIVHHREMLPQFDTPAALRVSYPSFAVGVTVFSLGLFKKVVLADTIALYATPVFAAADQGIAVSFFEAWGGVLSYAFQLYFDFSGYSDMAIGIALLFGIRLPINFNSPYKATSIIDFWRRWHMTLSRFLRDYLYVALGGNRHGVVRRYAHLLVTMLLGGLWHGAGWTFVAWGALHGVYLVLNHGWHVLRRARGHDLRRSSWGGRVTGRAVTFLAVLVAWVLFRAETMTGARAMVAGMTGLNGVVLDERLVTALGFLDGLIAFEGRQAGTFHLWGVPWLVLAGGLVWLMPNVCELVGYTGVTIRPRPDPETVRPDERVWWRWQPDLAWAVIIAGTILYSLHNMSKLSEFLYFQF